MSTKKPETIYEEREQLLADREHLRAINRDLMGALKALTEAVALSQERASRGELIGLIGSLTEPAEKARAAFAKAEEN